MNNKAHLYNGKGGWGYQPLKTSSKAIPPGPENQDVSTTIGGCERPATVDFITESAAKRSSDMEPMSVYSFAGFMWCAFCIGLAVGSQL